MRVLRQQRHDHVACLWPGASGLCSWPSGQVDISNYPPTSSPDNLEADLPSGISGTAFICLVPASLYQMTSTFLNDLGFWRAIRTRFLSLARSELRLCSANHRAGYFSNPACDWLSIVWAYYEQETENGPRWPSVAKVSRTISPPCSESIGHQ